MKTKLPTALLIAVFALLDLSYAEDSVLVLPPSVQFPSQSEQTDDGTYFHGMFPIPCVIEKKIADGSPADSDNYVYCVLIYNSDIDSTRNFLQEYCLLGAYPTLDAALDALTRLKDSRKASLNTVRKRPKPYRLLPPEGNLSLYTKEELERLTQFSLEFNCMDYYPPCL